MNSINNLYLKKEMLSAIKKTFKKEKMVALKNFASIKIDGKWRKICAPDKFNYEIHAPVPLQKEIASFTKIISGKAPVNEGVRRFSHGSYTILHDNDAQNPGVIALLFLDDWNEEWGGKLVLMRNGETVTSFVPQKNTLLILERKKKERYFVKYVNNKAGKNKLMIVSG
jgi:hypothetical protein